jgi:ribosome recycling factor
MQEVINQAIIKMDKAIEAMEKKFTNVRAGRANTSILDGIKVSYYGTDTPLIQLASISIPEARVISIKPFDKSSLSNIEKSLFEANLGIAPNNNGETVTLVFPALTEDRRKDYVKQVKGEAEECRIAIRTARQDANNAIKRLELPEDEEKRGMDRIQDLINDNNKKIDEKLKHKEDELMTI